MACSAAKAAARSGCAEVTATTSASGTVRAASTNQRAMKPAPIMPKRIGAVGVEAGPDWAGESDAAAVLMASR